MTQDQLAAFYRDARVGLITPLRDGMNLVAKEFAACQPEQDPGVLILSPFAGAGGYMQEALQVFNAISQIFTLILFHNDNMNLLILFVHFDHKLIVK